MPTTNQSQFTFAANQPKHPRLFWMWLAAFLLLSSMATALQIALGQPVGAVFLGLAMVLIAASSVITHRHAHQHTWLLISATVITGLMCVVFAWRLGES